MGTYWLTAHGQLYRAIPGLCVAQFPPEQRQPFIDSRTIKTAFIDPQGNVFLETYFRAHPDVGEYVILDSLTPLPQTKVHASVEASGIVKLHFETQTKGKGVVHLEGRRRGMELARGERGRHHKLAGQWQAQD